ncbi:MAG TPA: hypothetical protein PLL20_20805 [Phycisphaerae bacterium]|nr:hypothetical protein [Phycisphaerae bacterium]
MRTKTKPIEARIEACLAELRELNARRQTAKVRNRRRALQALYAAAGEELRRAFLR